MGPGKGHIGDRGGEAGQEEVNGTELELHNCLPKPPQSSFRILVYTVGCTFESGGILF